MKKIVFMLTLAVSLTSLSFAADAVKNVSNLDAGNDENVIIKAADLAGEKKDKDAIPSLLKLLDGNNSDMVRLHSVMALGYIGDESAVEELNKTLLNDKNSTVRYAAVLATVRIGSKKSLEAWNKALETETDSYVLDFLKKMQEKAKGK